MSTIGDMLISVCESDGIWRWRLRMAFLLNVPQVGECKCARNCPKGAITKNEKTGVYMISRKLCDGCGECVGVCPFGLIVKAPDKPYASKCTACGICAKACPMEMLEIFEKE